MEAFPVTIIVKVPNQKIEDQTVKCELSWTINKLKQHLSEVHPNKPPKHEQRLIYSGQLLPDSACLKDILRQYEGQEVHTVHLVCVSKDDFSKCQSSKTTCKESEDVVPSTDGITNISENTEEIMPHIQFPNMHQYQYYSQMNANQYAIHMSWMQQAYLQYMMQYTNLAAYTSPNNNITPNVNPRNTADHQPAVNRPVVDLRDPEVPERDWLDIFYMVIRMIALFSIIYFYSNPMRFIVVLLLGVGFYLYQTGFLRNFNNNNNNTPAENQNIDHTPSVLATMWTFLTTFFASLIPEIPNAA